MEGSQTYQTMSLELDTDQKWSFGLVMLMNLPVVSTIAMYDMIWWVTELTYQWVERVKRTKNDPSDELNIRRIYR